MENALLPADSLEIGVTLSELGRCVREGGQPRLAEEYLRKALGIVRGKLGPNDVQVTCRDGDDLVCPGVEFDPRIFGGYVTWSLTDGERPENDCLLRQVPSLDLEHNERFAAAEVAPQKILHRPTSATSSSNLS